LAEERLRTLTVAQFAIIPPEIKFRHVPLQVLFTNMVKSADQATLQ